MAESQDRSPADLLCDLLVYAPLGFAFDAPKVIPELAARGREQVAAARTVGKFVVQQANERLGPVLGSVLGGFLSGLGLNDDRGGAPSRADTAGSSTSEASQGASARAGGRGAKTSSSRTGSVGRSATYGALSSSSGSSPGSRGNGSASSGVSGAALSAGQEPPSTNGTGALDQAPQASELGIPDYDSLAASQVVPRLAALSPDELAAVRAYEAAHRGRRTILSRVDQLLGRPGAHGG